MATAGPVLSKRCIDPLVHRLGEQERSVLAVLIANRGRVVGRRELSRLAGMADLSERRCDSVLVSIRRILGPDSLITVRSRGWMLNEEAIAASEALAAGEPE
jgi:DNA-binding response OmpR family regulator